MPGTADGRARAVLRRLARHCFRSPLKPPFTVERRAEAGLPPDLRGPLTRESLDSAG